MTWTITTKFNPGDRVWMPDGNGGKMKGRVEGVSLFQADLSQPPGKAVVQSLNYKCIDIEGGTYFFHEYQLSERKI
ncbi:MAG: hypothetical protein J6S66_00645 [Bacteroidales bacterium]|nr:hypothetical protein [Bacteroidales bacterium]